MMGNIYSKCITTLVISYDIDQILNKAGYNNKVQECIISSSKWYKRLWTLQECALPNKVQILRRNLF